MLMLVLGLTIQVKPVDAAQPNKSVKAETHIWYFDKDTRKAVKAAGKDASSVNPLVTGSPTGLSPSKVKSVYNFPTTSTAGTGKTIAIVDAYDSTSAENDLKSFSRTFGLSNCTSSNGCFRKVNQNGSTLSMPKADTGGWRLEISLDVQWAHAIAPGAKILLVEANSNSFDDLFAGVNYAKKNADYVSMSWGAPEDTWVSYYDQFLTQPIGRSVSFFASAGDGEQYQATLRYHHLLFRSGVPLLKTSVLPNSLRLVGAAAEGDAAVLRAKQLIRVPFSLQIRLRHSVEAGGPPPMCHLMLTLTMEVSLLL